MIVHTEINEATSWSPIRLSDQKSKPGYGDRNTNERADEPAMGIWSLVIEAAQGEGEGRRGNEAVIPYLIESGRLLHILPPRPSGDGSLCN